jgi:homocysteine S-methyltransferase
MMGRHDAIGMNTDGGIANFITGGELVLTEGSVYELLRRDERIRFDSHIAHAGLIYEILSRDILAGVHREYIEIARRFQLPFVAFTDTWRASEARIAASAVRGRAVNRDNVEFLRGVASGSGCRVFIGALTGPKGDAYRPREAPTAAEALRYHAFQIAELAASEVDLLLAATLPAFPEAKAIASLMARSGVPSMLSFVVRPEGTLLDGTLLGDAIREIDDDTDPAPLAYSINCVHANVALQALLRIPATLRARVLAFQGNTSSLPPEEVDGLAHLDSMDPQPFAAAVTALTRQTAIRMVGGCCGTDGRHIDAVARAITR